MLDLLGLGALSEKADRNRRQNRSAAARVRGSGRLEQPLMGVAKACARAPRIIAHVQTQPQRNCTLGSRSYNEGLEGTGEDCPGRAQWTHCGSIKSAFWLSQIPANDGDPSVRLCLFGQSSSTAWICRRPCSSG